MAVFRNPETGNTLRYVEACEYQTWHLKIWPKGEPEKVKECPFRCRSWRHAGPCSHWKGSQDFRRVQGGLAKHDDWVYMVLTYPSGSWPNLRALYRAGVGHWSILRKRLTRRFGKIQYIQTWEQHKSGYPHLNLTVSNPKLYEDSCLDWREARKCMEKEAVASGFGMRLWLEPLKGKDSMAGYMCKLARELTGSNTKSQAPVAAPPHFRRIRASQGLLPPPYKNPNISGVMVFAEMPDTETRYKVDDYGEIVDVEPGPREPTTENYTYLCRDNMGDAFEGEEKCQKTKG